MMKKIAIVLLLLLALPFVISEQGSGNGNGNNNNNQIVGNDRDSRGCIGSAGYSWCGEKQKCVRNWEESCESDEDETNEENATGTACIQAITYATNDENKCRAFAAPCKVPEGWAVVQSCEGYAAIKNIKEIKEQIRERTKERIGQMKDSLEKLRERIKGSEPDSNKFNAVIELSIGQEKLLAEGISIRLVSIDSNCDANVTCPAVHSSAALAMSASDGNFSGDFVLEGNQRKVIAGISIKLLTTKGDSARVQILPIKDMLPPFLGAGKIRIIPNLGRIAKEIDDRIEDSNLLEDLNSMDNADIKSLVIGPMKKDIKAEIRSEGGRILKAIPLFAMQRIKAQIRSANGVISDLNIIQEDGNWIIQAPNGDTIPLKWDVEVDGNSLYIITPKEKKKLAVLPGEASEIAKLKANMHTVRAVQVEILDGVPVYKIKGTQAGKLFGLFGTSFDVDADLDIDSGQMKNIKRPWWAFLVFGK